jgi:ankyrin repeat protein
MAALVALVLTGPLAARFEISYDGLQQAISEGDVAAVAALLQAGLPLAGPNAERANGAVLNGLTTACERIAPQRIAPVLDLLVGRGFRLDHADAQGNQIMMTAAQLCPAPVGAHLIELGAAVDPVNRQQFTPLKLALVTGRWDFAKVLVDHGARITRRDAAQLFFEPPQDPEQRALLARATRGR